jgi:hypothetical protein
VAKKKFVALEPFVKLPVKKITTYRLRLIGTGLRLNFDFSNQANNPAIPYFIGCKFLA